MRRFIVYEKTREKREERKEKTLARKLVKIEIDNHGLPRDFLFLFRNFVILY